MSEYENVVHAFHFSIIVFIVALIGLTIIGIVTVVVLLILGERRHRHYMHVRELMRREEERQTAITIVDMDGEYFRKIQEAINDPGWDSGKDREDGKRQYAIDSHGTWGNGSPHDGIPVREGVVQGGGDPGERADEPRDPEDGSGRKTAWSPRHARKR